MAALSVRQSIFQKSVSLVSLKRLNGAYVLHPRFELFDASLLRVHLLVPGQHLHSSNVYHVTLCILHAHTELNTAILPIPSTEILEDSCA